MTKYSGNGWTFIDSSRVVSPNRKHPSPQVKACVRNTSKAALARALGDRTTSHINNYWSDCLNAEMEKALAPYPDGTVLVQAMDPGGLIDGTKGWTPLVPTHLHDGYERGEYDAHSDPRLRHD